MCDKFCAVAAEGVAAQRDPDVLASEEPVMQLCYDSPSPSLLLLLLL